jgi:hypothetical protein
MVTNDSDSDNPDFPTSPAALDWSYILKAAAAVATRVYVEGQELRPLPGAVASRLARLCQRDEIAEATLDQLIARGSGPRIFFIGKRRYALHSDWDAWLTRLAESGGVGISGHRALQQDVARICKHQSQPKDVPDERLLNQR